jgi:hypothetical protein
LDLCDFIECCIKEGWIDDVALSTVASNTTSASQTTKKKTPKKNKLSKAKKNKPKRKIEFSSIIIANGSEDGSDSESESESDLLKPAADTTIQEEANLEDAMMQSSALILPLKIETVEDHGEEHKKAFEPVVIPLSPMYQLLSKVSDLHSQIIGLIKIILSSFIISVTQ